MGSDYNIAGRIEIFPFRPFSDIDFLIYMIVFALVYYLTLFKPIDRFLEKTFGSFFGSPFFVRLTPMGVFVAFMLVAIIVLDSVIWKNNR